ncbi:MAG: prolyl oligopeptidase family serine peptidase [Bacteroidetes bacterium]|nr:prolyl oligopeptidase family serine peptidase [Bacteroidota bacterium]
MKFRYITLIVYFVLSAFSLRAQTFTDSFVVDGIYRNYICHLPAGYSPASTYPLVLNLHGYTSNAVQQEAYTQMDGSADAHGYIVVYPNGVDSFWNSWGPATGGPYGANDVKFLTELIDTISQRYHVNQKRVYSCGISNGGYMTYALACAITDRLAAVASVSGTMSNYTVSTCHPSRKIPVMHVHGTSDPIVPYTTGASLSIGVEQVMVFWRDTDACQHTTDTTDLANTNLADGCTVQTIHYPHCAAGNDLLLYKIANGGHTWPGGAINIPLFGNTDRDISGTDEIWKFFDRYTLDGPVAGVEEVSTISFALYPDPATSTLIIAGVPDMAEASVSDLMGHKVIAHIMGTQVDVSSLPGGIYTVQIQNDKGQTGVLKFVKQ